MLDVVDFAICSAGDFNSPRAQQILAPLRDFLETHAGFGESEMRALAEGWPVAKVAATKSGDEIAVVGAIRVAVPRRFFLRRFTNIVEFKTEQSIPEVAKFEKIPALARTIADRIWDQPVNAQRRQNERDQSKRAEQDRFESLRRRLLSNHVIHRRQIGNWQIAVGFFHLLA